MRIKYDAEVDILTIQLPGLKGHQGAKELAPGVIVHSDEDGTPVRIKVMQASKRYDTAQLAKHPADYREPLTLVDAARIANSTRGALAKAIERGRLKGEKKGGAWFTTIEKLTEYLNSRAHEGPGSATDDAPPTLPSDVAHVVDVELLRGEAPGPRPVVMPDPNVLAGGRNKEATFDDIRKKSRLRPAVQEASKPFVKAIDAGATLNVKAPAVPQAAPKAVAKNAGVSGTPKGANKPNR